MALSSSTLMRIAALPVEKEVMQEILSIFADMQKGEEARLEGQRERKRRSRDRHSDKRVTVTGRSQGQDRDGHSDPSPKESSPTPPKEITPPLAAKAARSMPAEAGGSQEKRLCEEVKKGGVNGQLFMISDFVEPVDMPDIPEVLKRYPQEFEELWQTYREHIGEKNSSKAKSFGYWKKLDDQDREDCLIGLSEYCMWAMEERKKRTDVKLKHLETFINGRNWEPYLEKVE